jgi:hypothetical protein
LSDICPKTIQLRSAHREDGTFEPYNISLVKNIKTANITAIKCNSGITVPIKVLSCRYTRKDDKNECEYYNHDAERRACEIEPELAHVYITTELSNPIIKHYIIIFIEGIKIGWKEELVQILVNTISLLSIENERPHFYIYYYGPPTINNELNNIRMYLNKKLKSQFNNYASSEDICTTSNIPRNSTVITISESNPFRFVIA